MGVIIMLFVKIRGFGQLLMMKNYPLVKILLIKTRIYYFIKGKVEFDVYIFKEYK